MRALHRSFGSECTSFGGRRAGVHDQRGETLIELMVAVLIMGTAIVAILGAIAASIRTSAQHRESVRAGNAATMIAELIETAPYVPCESNYSSAYAAPNYQKPAEFTVSVRVTYLASKTTSTPTFNGSGCTTANDQGLQEVTITVRSSRAGGMTETVTLAKRKA